MAEPASISSPGPMAGESARRPWTPHPALICALLALVSAVVFCPVVRDQFVTYDDPDYITDNTHVKGGLTARDVEWAFRTGHAGNWHPLTWLSHMLDVELFGLKPGGHHVTNLVFHIVNSILLFLLLRPQLAPGRHNGLIRFSGDVESL